MPQFGTSQFGTSQTGSGPDPDYGQISRSKIGDSQLGATAISGTVIDTSTGDPIENAQVVAIQQDGSHIHTTTTDSNGNYSFKSLTKVSHIYLPGYLGNSKPYIEVT